MARMLYQSIRDELKRSLGDRFVDIWLKQLYTVELYDVQRNHWQKNRKKGSLLSRIVAYEDGDKKLKDFLCQIDLKLFSLRGFDRMKYEFSVWLKELLRVRRVALRRKSVIKAMISCVNKKLNNKRCVAEAANKVQEMLERIKQYIVFRTQGQIRRFA